MPYQMKNGRWRAKKMIAGRVKTRLCATKKEALAWESAQSASQWTAAETQTDTVSVLEWANQYLDHACQTLVPHSQRTKLRNMRYLLDVVPHNMPASQLRPAHVLATVQHVRATHSGDACNRLLRNLSPAWMWGVKYLGLPKDNPFSECDKVPADRKPRYMPTEDDFWKAYAKARPENKLFLLTALHTAARLGELLRLTWGDIDLDGRTIRLGTRKRKGGGMEYDIIPLTSTLADRLSEHKTTARSMFVFCDHAGQPYRRRETLMPRLCMRAGITTFGMHAIRHLSASMLAKAGVDIPTIQAILRHKTPTTTARYLKQIGGVAPDLDRVFSGVGVEEEKNVLAHKLAHGFFTSKK